jgi:hypothetical protein
MIERCAAAGSGGNSTSAGTGSATRGASQSITFRLPKNEAAMTATPSRIVLRLTGGSFHPSDLFN